MLFQQGERKELPEGQEPSSSAGLALVSSAPLSTAGVGVGERYCRQRGESPGREAGREAGQALGRLPGAQGCALARGAAGWVSPSERLRGSGS